MAKTKSKRKKKEKPVLRAEGIERLLEDGGKNLTDDERALILAMAEVEADSLSDEERAALEKLQAKVEAYDTNDLARAVKQMVSAEAIEERKVKWPELKRRLRSAKSKK